jgi:hypothetical protein
MKALYKGLATVAFYGIAIGLMGYAALRSLHFVQMSLPADSQLLGYLALLATSGGMIGWLLVFLHKASGVWQKVISFLMIAVCAIGETALFALDTLYVTGEAGLIAQMTPEEVRAVLIGMSGLIAANIIATVAYHIFEPENMREMKESFVKDKLEGEAMKIIEKRGEEIARELAPKIAEQWAADFEARFQDMAALGIGNVKREDDKKPARKALPTWQAPTPAASVAPFHAETCAPGELVQAQETEAGEESRNPFQR